MKIGGLAGDIGHVQDENNGTDEGPMEDAKEMQSGNRAFIAFTICPRPSPSLCLDARLSVPLSYKASTPELISLK
jgi:hypothetical protein